MRWDQLVRVLLNGWWVIAIAMVVAVGGAFALTRSAEKEFRASTSLVVAPAVDPATPELVLASLEMLRGEGNLVPTFVDLLGSDRFLLQAGEAGGYSPEELAGYTVTASSQPQSSVVMVAVAGPDGESAAELTQGVSDAASVFFAERYPPFSLNVVDEVTVPTEPEGTGRTVTLTIAAIAGAVVGSLIVVAWKGPSSGGPGGRSDADADDRRTASSTATAAA